MRNVDSGLTRAQHPIASDFLFDWMSRRKTSPALDSATIGLRTSGRIFSTAPEEEAGGNQQTSRHYQQSGGQMFAYGINSEQTRKAANQLRIPFGNRVGKRTHSET